MSEKLPRLGKGLGALIPDLEPHVITSVSTINIELIRPNRFQPRRLFDQDKLLELSESIKENGLIQPLVVVKIDDTGYELIAGERRLEACKLAGLTDVPIYVREVSEKERLILSIVENVQREDLTPIEEAKAYQQLAEDFQLTHLDIAKIMGKDRATITNALRLLKLSDTIQGFIEAKQISPGHARAILSVAENLQEKFTKEIINHQLSVRRAEEMAKSYSGLDTNPVYSPQKPTLPKAKILENKYLDAIEAKITNIVRAKVKIVEKENAGGDIIISFKDQDHLEEILNIINRELNTI